MAKHTGSLIPGRKGALRSAIESGTYQRMGQTERATQDSQYLGRVPNYGGRGGKRSRSR